jgi:hypothetical protein
MKLSPSSVILSTLREVLNAIPRCSPTQFACFGLALDLSSRLSSLAYRGVPQRQHLCVSLVPAVCLRRDLLRCCAPSTYLLYTFICFSAKETRIKTEGYVVQSMSSLIG